jgi:cytochrome b involved in lipid metabolism
MSTERVIKVDTSIVDVAAETSCPRCRALVVPSKPQPPLAVCPFVGTHCLCRDILLAPSPSAAAAALVVALSPTAAAASVEVSPATLPPQSCHTAEKSVIPGEAPTAASEQDIRSTTATTPAASATITTTVTTVTTTTTTTLRPAAPRPPKVVLDPDPAKNIFTWSEVRQHVHEDDCWLVVEDTVYDATSFLDWHPAGKKTILRHAGTDCSAHLEFHSRKARKIWATLEIGRLPENAKPRMCSLM